MGSRTYVSFVLDSSAILAMIFDEPGADAVLAQCPGGLLSAVNLDEILHKVARRGMDPLSVEEYLAEAGVTVVPFDHVQARQTAALHPQVYGTGTSFADRVCLALAMTAQKPVLSSDAAWVNLGLNVDVTLIR